MMGKQLKPNIKIKGLLEKSNFFYQDLLGYKPVNTELESISENRWKEFTESYGLDPNSSGIFLPRNKSAIIRDKNPLSLYHEYFGHGLYCEQNLTGRRFVELEKKLLEEEKLAFKNKKFNLDELREFRKTNQTFQELEEHREKNIGNYELFAIWTEYLLSRENNMNGLFEKKYDSLDKKNKDVVESVINFSKRYGDLTTMYSQGMARRTTVERVKRLLEDVYGKEAVRKSRLILLSGSKKPFSDIDLFISSDYIKSTKNSWLDVVSETENSFERSLKLFDIQFTYPLFYGEVVLGDKKYLEEKRIQLLNRPITSEAISFNLRMYKENKIFSENTQDNALKKIGKSYSETYLANALALKEGERIFEKEKLLKYSKERQQGATNHCKCKEEIIK